MTYMVTLEGMEIYARHGVFDIERSVDQRFQVDCSCEISNKTPHQDQLQHTMDYSMIAAVIQEVFRHPCKLLETLVDHCIQAIIEADPRVISISIKIKKWPIGMSELKGGVSVQGTWSKHHAKMQLLHRNVD